MAISKIDSDGIVSGGITADSLNIGQIGGRRNLIINGAMQVAQRGTSHSTAGYGSLDRWYLALSGATATLSQESFTLGQTDVVGAEYYAKVDVTTGNNNCGLYYKVEAKDVIQAGGQDVTLSYWAKGTSPTNGLKVGLSLVATGGSAVTDESVTLTSTWTKYTHTFTLPSFSGVTLDASSYLELHFDQDNGDTGTAAWELNIAQVQLEVGTVATPFEHRSYGEELALCRRYFERLIPDSFSGMFALMQAYSSGNAQGMISYHEKRAAPSYNQVGTMNLRNATGNSDVATFSSADRDLRSAFIVYNRTSGGLTAGNASVLRVDMPGGYIDLDAEL